MKAWGLGATIKQSEKTVEVEPENEAAVRVFLGMQTQWRHTAISLGLGGAALVRTGLEYAALAIIAEAHGTRLDADVLFAIQQLERATLDIDHAKRKQRR